MWKSLLFAGALSVAAFAGPAEAKTSINIFFGVPFYTYQVGPGYRYHPGYGWYDYRRYPKFVGRLSCFEARRIVRSHGYRDVIARDCSGRTYAFSGWRGGHRFILYVNSRSGGLWRG